ncbi:MAG: hypothetical protein J2P23_00710 [Microlunatus sp.]|nr:hypothetical protein [Microlunatus sp.]
MAEAVAAEPGPGLLGQMARAAGNPLYVTELVGAIQRAGDITVVGGLADLAEHSLPATLRQTILRRLSFVGEDTLQTLRVAAILGVSFTLTDLSTVADRPALDLSVTLAEAVAAGIVSDDGKRLRFRHELIHDVIYEELPGSVRLGLHREAGRRLAAAGVPAQQVAEQLARGAVPGEAVAWLIRAGREAASTSPAAAADLLGRAIGLMGPTDPTRDRVLVEHATCLLSAGRISDAVAVCRGLLSRAHDPATEGAARICLGHALLTAGHPRDAVQELDRAGEAPLLTDSERATGLGWASNARMWLGDLDGVTATAERARSAAAAAGDHMTATLATAMFGVVALLNGRLAEADRFTEDATRLADHSPDRQGHRYPSATPRGFVLVERDQLEQARSTLDIGSRISEELGLVWHQPTYEMVSVAERFVSGEWDDALAEADASLAFAHESGERHSLIFIGGVRSLIKLHRNDIASALTSAQEAVDVFVATGLRYRSQWALWARALALEAGGRPADAYAALAEVWDQCAGIGFVIDYRVLGPDLVRLALAQGDHQRAADVAAAVTRLAEDNDVPSLTGAALRCRGLADSDVGTLIAAAEAYAHSPRRFDLAQACEDAGTALARDGSRAAARQFTGRALEIYDDIGATRDMLRTEAALRDLGVRRGRRGVRARPQLGWDSLTPTERTVADLVAEGLSNPQVGERLYVSRRTVQTHLAHIFTKLDISSRAQLAAEVAQRR